MQNYLMLLFHFVQELFQEKLWSVIRQHKVSAGAIYNADQTGLFYNKLPNFTFVRESERKTVRGCKKMTSKDRLTLMICTSAAGGKVPIALVGKSVRPRCFDLIPGTCGVPLPYINQKNAWFDQTVSLWWLKNVFWPHHTRTHGLGVTAILLLDNCTAHKELNDPTYRLANRIPDELIIIFLPPNTTSKLQPADMGIIACLKVGYKITMLRKLLTLFDEDGGFQAVANARANARRGCKGLAVGGKAHVLDVMQILAKLWNEDRKYARTQSVKNCWLKADVLPPEIAALLRGTPNNAADISTTDTSTAAETPQSDNAPASENEFLPELVAALQQTNVSVRNDSVASSVPVFENSILTHEISTEDLYKAGEVWVNIEDDPFVLEAEIEAEDESMSVADSETEEAEDEGDVEELDLSALSLEDANEVNAMKPKDFFEQKELLKNI